MKNTFYKRFRFYVLLFCLIQSLLCVLMGPIDGGRLVNGCHWPWMLGLSVWKGLRMRMMSSPDWFLSLDNSSEICGAVLFVTISSLTLPFTAEEQRRNDMEQSVTISSSEHHKLDRFLTALQCPLPDWGSNSSIISTTIKLLYSGTSKHVVALKFMESLPVCVTNKTFNNWHIWGYQNLQVSKQCPHFLQIYFSISIYCVLWCINNVKSKY